MTNRLFSAFALAATALLAASPSLAQGFAPGVAEDGAIALPAVDWRRDWSHLGAWSVLGENGVDFHNVYTQKETVDAFRRDGAFPDGAVLIKELLSGETEFLTTGEASHATETVGWFVMVRDAGGRFEGDPLWGDGWGWAFFDVADPSVTTTTDYVADCLGCHEPVRDSELVYSYAYPALRAE